MPRFVHIVLIVSLCYTTASRAEESSPGVRGILDKAVGEVKKHYGEYIKANEKPAEQAKRDLEKLARNLIDEGKAENAIAALRAIELIDSETVWSIGSVLHRCPESTQVVEHARLQVQENRQTFYAANAETLREARSALQELARQQLNEGKRTDAAATLKQLVTLASEVMSAALGDVLNPGTDDLATYYATDPKNALKRLSLPMTLKGFVPEGREFSVEDAASIR